VTVRFVGLSFTTKCAICGADADKVHGIWQVLLYGGVELQICPPCRRAHPEDPLAIVLERLRQGNRQ
jgi:hypothetical protein